MTGGKKVCLIEGLPNCYRAWMSSCGLPRTPLISRAQARPPTCCVCLVRAFGPLLLAHLSSSHPQCSDLLCLLLDPNTCSWCKLLFFSWNETSTFCLIIPFTIPEVNSLCVATDVIESQRQSDDCRLIPSTNNICSQLMVRVAGGKYLGLLQGLRGRPVSTTDY